MGSQWGSKDVGTSVTTIVVFVLTLFILIPVPVRAQVAGATLSGVVQDSSGAAVPNASISVKNTETGVSRDVTTDTVGFYNVPNLAPGPYEVTVTAQGFSKLVRTGITLIVGAQQTLNLGLQVGQVSQTVEVTAEAPAVELTSSAISAEVNPTTIVELPLNGRDWSSLATLQPGTIGIRTEISTVGSKNRVERGFGAGLAIGGHRPTENNYRVNGISVNDYTNNAPGSVAGSQLGVDAIQEFSVLTTNYSAEYGRTSGGVINAITKQGTNAIHGSAYWFLRDDKLDGKSFFSKTRSPFHRNQFGASAGGPIQKDKTFWFAAFEGIRQDLGLNASNLVVPSMAVRQGTLCSQPSLAPSNAPCTTHQITGAFNPDPTTGIDKAVLPYLPLWPLPDGGPVPGGSGDTGFFISSPYQQYTENYVTSRVDHKFSDKDSLDVVWFFDRSPQSTPDPFLESLAQTFSERWMGGIEETHIFSPQLANTFRTGFSRTVGISNEAVPTALQPIASDTSLGIVPNAGLTAPKIQVSGIAIAQGSVGSQVTQSHVMNSFQFYDDAFLTKGAHALKFGFMAEHMQADHLSNPTTGSFTFGSLLAFLQNVPISGSGDPRTASLGIGGRQTFYGGYVQDDWHARPNLTLNLGLRYEMATLPSEALNRLSSVLGGIFGGGVPVASPHIWNTNATLRNFEPRIGFAWDPFHDGKTSVRAGFGIFDILPGPWDWVEWAGGVFPFSNALSAGSGTLVAGDFPYNSVAKAKAAALRNAYATDPNPKRNYSMNWNLNIQRQLTSTLTATLGYMGNHSVHSTFSSDTENMVPPTIVPGLSSPVSTQGDVWPCGPPLDSTGRCTTGHGTLIDPLVSTLHITPWASAAKYNAFLAQVTKRMSHGLQVQGSFTWSRCFDNTSSGGNVGDGFQNSLSSQIFFTALDRLAPCDFDIPRNFVGNWIWDVPVPKSSSAIVTRLTGGWELGGIVTASTGSPFTMVMGGDPLGQNSTDPWDFPSRLAGCNPINSNYRTTAQYVNTSCFIPAVAPASFISQCANFPGAASPPPSGMVYCANLFGTAGRNSLYGPGLFDWDFSVFKNNYIPRISESFNVQFRAEFFNVLNHTNFQSPVDNIHIFSATGAPTGGAGLIDSVATDPREIQFGLKVIW